jgi:hypothetical protein
MEMLDLTISTKPVSLFVPGSYSAIFAGIVGMGKQQNKYDPSKPAQVKFVGAYASFIESELAVWCRTYSLSWGPKSAFQKECGILFSQEEIDAGQVSPLALLGRPCQLIFAAGRDEKTGAEKVGLAAVGKLPKTPANIEIVTALKARIEPFSFDASKGERPSLEVMKLLPKWLLEQIEVCGAVPNPAPAAKPQTASPTAAFIQQATAQNEKARAGEPFDDDVTW